MELQPEVVVARLRRAVLVLVFLATIARILPIGYDAPVGGLFSSDEIDAVSRALKFATGDVLPIHANKPTHYAEVLAAAYAVQFAAEHVVVGTSREDFERRFFLTPFPFFAAARGISAVCALGTLSLLLWSLRRHGLGAQLLAIALVGLAPSSVKFAHIAKEDALAAFWTFAAMACALEALAANRLGRPGKRDRWFGASAAAAGLAVSTKYNCFFAVLFPALAWWELWRSRSSDQTGPLVRTAWISLVAFVGGVVLGTPAIVVSPLRFLRATLASDIVSEVGHGLASLPYAEKYGLAFFARIWEAEFGWAWVSVLLTTGLFAERARVLRIIIGLPAIIYLATLFFAGHLDYQYTVVLTPVLAWILAHEMTARAATAEKRLVRLAILAFLVLGLAQNAWRVARRTMEYLGGDTRLAAARWLERQARSDPKWREKPLLIVAPFYYRYHPAVAFTPATYARLFEQARASGREGGYFQKARQYAATDRRLTFDAEFLDVKWHFRRQPDGTRIFLPQHFSLNLADYGDRYSAVCLPEATALYLSIDPPEAQDVVAFVRAIRSLPLLAEFHSRPWRLAGPSIWILAPPQQHPATRPAPASPAEGPGTRPTRAGAPTTTAPLASRLRER